jgi:hypothetical protein
MSYRNLINKAMKKIINFILMIILIIVLYSCAKPKGIWDDNIHLSTKTSEFSASGDSITIKTGGSWWWITGISVDGTNYGCTRADLQADNYSIKQDCFDVKHRDKNTLFIKVVANPNNVPRNITVGLQAGDYFDRVTITQKAN